MNTPGKPGLPVVEVALWETEHCFAILERLTSASSHHNQREVGDIPGTAPWSVRVAVAVVGSLGGRDVRAGLIRKPDVLDPPLVLLALT